MARFNLTKFENEEAWKSNYFQGIPSPAGGCLILFPIMYELSSFNIFFDAKIISPYLVVFVSFLLISKIPTFSFKKIVVQRHLTLFLLLGFGLFFVSIIQFTYETMVICSFVYVLLIPISVLSFRSKLKNAQKEIIQEDQRDIL